MYSLRTCTVLVLFKKICCSFLLWVSLQFVGEYGPTMDQENAGFITHCMRALRLFTCHPVLGANPHNRSLVDSLPENIMVLPRHTMWLEVIERLWARNMSKTVTIFLFFLSGSSWSLSSVSSSELAPGPNLRCASLSPCQCMITWLMLTSTFQLPDQQACPDSYVFKVS